MGIRIVFIALFTVVVVPFLTEMGWAIAIEASLDELFRHFGWEHGKGIARLSPYIIVALAAYLLVSAALWIERSTAAKKPVTDIDPRVAFKNILRNKRWRRANAIEDGKGPSWLDQQASRDRLAKQFHDLLVDGRVAARGRKVSKGGNSGPEDWIPKEDWHSVEIVFDGKQGQLKVLAARRDGSGIEYVDVHLSSRQLAKCFRVPRRLLLAAD